ncbi:MAG: DUF559 domain-containing protein [Myxococcales bacterium]|nr:DUF559 domain-containing protein [Myxococcales bacterium]
MSDEVRAALALAAMQHGVLRRDQAFQLGLSARQVDRLRANGAWRDVFRSVYRVDGAPETWLCRLHAAALWAAGNRREATRLYRERPGRQVGDHVYAISHRAAAALHGFNRYPEGALELSVTRGTRCPASLTIYRVDALLPEKDVIDVGGLSVTSIPRTLVDLARSEADDDVRASVEQALSRRWMKLEELEKALRRSGRRPGIPFLKALVREYQGGDGPAESELESRVFELFKEAGLPRPLRQQRVRGRGRQRRLDFLIPGTRVVIEADGYAHHSSLEAFEEDRQRTNALLARGFKVLHWTWAGLHDDPQRLLTELLQVLRAAA